MFQHEPGTIERTGGNPFLAAALSVAGMAVAFAVDQSITRLERRHESSEPFVYKHTEPGADTTVLGIAGCRTSKQHLKAIHPGFNRWNNLFVANAMKDLSADALGDTLIDESEGFDTPDNDMVCVSAGLMYLLHNAQRARFQDRFHQFGTLVIESGLPDARFIRANVEKKGQAISKKPIRDSKLANWLIPEWQLHTHHEPIDPRSELDPRVSRELDRAAAHLPFHRTAAELEFIHSKHFKPGSGRGMAKRIIYICSSGDAVLDPFGSYDMTCEIFDTDVELYVDGRRPANDHGGVGHQEAIVGALEGRIVGNMVPPHEQKRPKLYRFAA